METFVLIGILVFSFYAMKRGVLELEIAMPLVALCGLVLAGPNDADHAVREGFAEFSKIAILFTAVAIPAHLLQRSNAFNWMGMLVGEYLGMGFVRFRISPTLLISFTCLIMAYILAALFHNTTSILISARLITTICRSYELRALPVLCGSLVASNLGGFSTRWGDTPNITEAMIWGLNHKHFLIEILPVNLILLLLLSVVISVWFRRSSPKIELGKNFNTTFASVRFRNSRLNTVIDWRLVAIGFIGLSLAIVGPIIKPSSEIHLSAFSIVFCCLADRPINRKATLLSLSFDTYITLCSIFVLARILTSSHIGIGPEIKSLLENSGMSMWAIVSISYLGTMLTEAASWASAASPIVFASAPTNAAAWALGAGICAGSSSFVTAASAGVLLINETKHNDKADQVTFGTYAVFGLTFSLAMLAYFIIVLSIIW